MRSSSIATSKDTFNSEENNRHCDELITIFNDTFFASYNTRLIKGGAEPEYIPCDSQCEYHQIIFTQNYFSSALHEVAHWCLAGEQRRLQQDYGYWYEPDGRTAQQQKVFEQVEVKPQALEWVFSNACDVMFCVSADNMLLSQGPSQCFKQAVVAQAIAFCDSARHSSLNKRAMQWINVLSNYYQTSHALDARYYSLHTIR